MQVLVNVRIDDSMRPRMSEETKGPQNVVPVKNDKAMNDHACISVDENKCNEVDVQRGNLILTVAEGNGSCCAERSAQSASGRRTLERVRAESWLRGARKPNIGKAALREQGGRLEHSQLLHH
jgi:hypothetical protein